MDFMSAREVADKWGISHAVLCSEGRIANATMVGNMWIIHAAIKPIDTRRINGDEIIKLFYAPH